jgi:hypothetical protein
MGDAYTCLDLWDFHLHTSIAAVRALGHKILPVGIAEKRDERVCDPEH